MKKFFKFLFGTVSLATLACGSVYLYKKFISKDSSDELDDFEDEFEDEFEDFDTDEFDVPDTSDVREYVSINITSENNSEDDDTMDELKSLNELESEEALAESKELEDISAELEESEEL